MSEKSLKAELRREALARRDALVGERRVALNAAISTRLLELSADWPPGPVSGYWPIRGEYDARPALAELAARGRLILLPRVGPDGLSFHRYAIGAGLFAGRFGLSEPGPDAPAHAPVIMLTPLAAFDRRAHRIGYGAGYYDRAIARLQARGVAPLTIGAAFAIQEVDNVPDEPHDRPLDCIVTENEIVRPSDGEAET